MLLFLFSLSLIVILLAFLFKEGREGETKGWKGKEKKKGRENKGRERKKWRERGRKDRRKKREE